MRRPRTTDVSLPGQDSFLDVVSNMVGILIILVVVVGLRASTAPIEAEPAAIAADPEPAPVAADTTDKLKQRAASIHSDIHEINEQVQRVSLQVEGTRLQRDRMLTVVEGLKQELARRRKVLSADDRRAYDAQRRLAEQEAQLQALNKQRESLNQLEPDVVQIQNLPTPLSRTVHSKEVHYQLRGGRVTPIPLDELLERGVRAGRDLARGLRDAGEIASDEVGPIGGFRLRLEIGRMELPPAARARTGARFVTQLVRWELVAESSDLGEPVDEALRAGSRFRYSLAHLKPSETSITVWTYPDSFAEFRRIKADLHALGYGVAARPLPPGERIAGSPRGSRSAAQ